MKENIRKAFLLGLGALSYSEKKYQQIIDEMMEVGEEKEKEQEEFVTEVKEKFQENKENFEKALKDEVKKAISSMGLVQKEEFDALKEEVEKLKKKPARRTTRATTPRTKKKITFMDS